MPSPARGEQAGGADFRSQFLQLCDLASAQIKAGTRKDPFFVDSYAVRALCVAYDLTGKKEYLDACRAWSERMVGFQEKMLPRGAYYMHYSRKPGEDKGGWYVADSSSIAMGVLATAVRCDGAEKQAFPQLSQVLCRAGHGQLHRARPAAFATGCGRSSTASGGAVRASSARWRSCSTTRPATSVA